MAARDRVVGSPRTRPNGVGAVRRRLKRAARVALKGAAVVVDPLFGKFPGPRILIYHQVGVSLGREMEVSTQRFVEQLDWIQGNGEIVDLKTGIERRAEPDADSLFVLTFDDGFEDVYHNAFPHMRARGIPFTLYLTTRPIETGEPLDARYPEARPLTWDQVNEMVETGLVTVGAHTHSHPDLRGMPADAIRTELDVSNELIRQNTATIPRHFTYPWGWWSEAADSIVRERYVSSTVGGRSRITSNEDSYRIPRLPVQRSDSRIFFTCRMKRGLRLEEGTRSMLAQYR